MNNCQIFYHYCTPICPCLSVTLPLHILVPKTGLRSSGETAWQYGEVASTNLK
jgi:hypothetical protein